MRKGLGFLLLISFGWAHHGSTGGEPLSSGLLHPFTGIDHLAAALAVGLWGAYLSGRKALLPALLFLSATAFGASAGFKGLSLPFTEWGALLSLPLLGLLLLKGKTSERIALPLVALFGLYHGNLHGLEAPAVGLSYLVGLLLSTAFLHGAGLLTGRLLREQGLKLAGAGLLLLTLFLL